MPGRPELLSRKGYLVLRSLLRDPKLSLLRRYVMLRAKRGTLASGDGQLDSTPAAYGDVFVDGLLSDLLPSIEKASGLELFPTYSYLRVYKCGDRLRRHRDRPECEISVSIPIGYEPNRPWPLWIGGLRETASVSLECGDALLYRGVDCAHWRDPFSGDRCIQVMLHYVDRHGSNAGRRFDRRSGLGSIPGRSRR